MGVLTGKSNILLGIFSLTGVVGEDLCKINLRLRWRFIPIQTKEA